MYLVRMIGETVFVYHAADLVVGHGCENSAGADRRVVDEAIDSAKVAAQPLRKIRNAVDLAQIERDEVQGR